MRVFYSFYLLFFLCSCYTTDISTQTNSLCDYKTKDIKEVKKIISISRGACFGTCPIYLISIFFDRSAIYHGKKFVDKIGEIEFKLSEEEINSILQKAKKINYCQLEDKYFEHISDLPRIYVQIFDKKVLDYYGAPNELKELEKLIDKICFRYIK